MSQLQHVDQDPDTTPLQIRSHRRAKWAWFDTAVLDTYGPTLGPIGLALYMGLCRYANSTTGKCWPSLARLSRQCGISQMSASRHLKTLVRCGLIAIEQRPGTTALITILDIPESPLTELGVPADPHPTEGTPPSQSWGTPLTELGEPSLLNQTNEPPPNPPDGARAQEEETLSHPRDMTRSSSVPPCPLPDRPDEALLTVDIGIRAVLEVQARAALLAEGVRVDHLIRPVLETRMLALWEAQNQGGPLQQEETLKQEHAA